MSFRKFDIFKKLPKDLTEPTFCGALSTHKTILRYYYYSVYSMHSCPREFGNR